ncbi:MAG: hypothetical protein A2027_03695 [Thermodesulfovibrio sp. RBG_19FT_COMBO_41_18]|nr:MAG: hypothetical protein A2027_03695 [Thermodesulfovibrio sp. RBG_19FT_COMBO_41_18]
MIHMTANLTVSAFYKKAGWPRWRAFAVPLAGLFQLICPSVSDTIFVTFKFTILRFGTEFLLYNLRSFAGIFTRMSIAWLFSANRKVINWRV